jgi:RNA polymerase sigma-70 factor, ECF subfamily
MYRPVCFRNQSVSKYQILMDDNELVTRILLGEILLFRIFVEKYQIQIINTCNGFVHNRIIAEDLAQEVFIRAYQSLPGFKGNSSLGTWLYRIAVNQSLNYLRDHRKERDHLPIPQGSTESENPILRIAADPSNYADKVMEDEERRLRLHKAIDKLPENQRTAFILQKYEEMSVREIAEVMESSQSAVESLLTRARKNLQQFLFDYYKNR